MSKSLRNRLVLATLMLVFVLYCFVVYFQPSASSIRSMSDIALTGEKLWQENNCTSCHQLYGLGGYLGPDLTNVASKPGKTDLYLQSFLDGGVGAMPKFNFSVEEKSAIIAFLRHVDSTGYYPERNAEFSKDGWVEIHYK